MVSRVSTATHTSTGRSRSTALQPPLETLSGAKKATKMCPTKSTTARLGTCYVLSYASLITLIFRNLYAIFCMAEHLNATSAEFSAAFKNLDKSTLLMSCINIYEVQIH
jgi:hypothetical protein